MLKRKSNPLNYMIRGVVRREQKGAKAAFEISAKSCVFLVLLSQYSNEKRNSERPSELLIP